MRLSSILLNLILGIVLLAPSPQMAAALSQFQVGADPLPRIKALRDAGRLPEALEAATAALRAEPGRRDLRVERGFLLGALGRYEEALTEYQTLLAENPGDIEALLEHAQVKTLQRKYDEAEGEFRFVLAMAPGLPGAAFGLGDVLTWKGDLAGARAAYLEYVRARPDDPQGYLRLGNVAAQAGDAAEAAGRFREALRLDPGNAEARAGLGRTEGAAAREYRFRYEIGYTYETLTRGEPDWQQGAMLLHFRPWAGTEFNVGAQAYHRFGENDQLVTLGFEQGFFPVDGDLRLLTLSGQFSQSLNNGRLLPKQIYEGQLAVRTAPWLQLFGGYSFSDFAGNLTAGTVSPGLQVFLHGGGTDPAPVWRRFSLLWRYYRTESTGNEPSNAFMALVEHDTVVDDAGLPRLQLYLGGARGGLAAGALTSEEFRNANSQYWSGLAGLTWRILRRFGIKADYSVQAVKHVYVKHSFGLTTFVEF